jgi:hypothetical protein
VIAELKKERGQARKKQTRKQQTRKQQTRKRRPQTKSTGAADEEADEEEADEEEADEEEADEEEADEEMPAAPAPAPASANPPTAPGQAGASRPRKRKETGRPVGRPGGGQQTDKQKTRNAVQQAWRLRAKCYQAMSACSAALGGAGPFTGFFVKMCERAVSINRRAKRKNVFLQRDIVDQVLDNAPLWKAFKKNMDARRKPPISQFVIAHLTGVTYSAMSSCERDDTSGLN